MLLKASNSAPIANENQLTNRCLSAEILLAYSTFFLVYLALKETTLGFVVGTDAHLCI